MGSAKRLKTRGILTRKHGLVGLSTPYPHADVPFGASGLSPRSDIRRRHSAGLILRQEEGLALRQSMDIESVTEVTQATLFAASMGDWPLTPQPAGRAIRHLQWGTNQST
jgi:hypothetical protein